MAARRQGAFLSTGHEADGGADAAEQDVGRDGKPQALFEIGGDMRFQVSRDGQRWGTLPSLFSNRLLSELAKQDIG